MYRADVEVALGLYRLNEVIYPPTSSRCSRVVVCRGCYTRQSCLHLQHMCRRCVLGGATRDSICLRIYSINLGLEVKQSTVGFVSLIMLFLFLLPSMSLYGLQRFLKLFDSVCNCSRLRGYFVCHPVG